MKIKLVSVCMAMMLITGCTYGNIDYENINNSNINIYNTNIENTDIEDSDLTQVDMDLEREVINPFDDASNHDISTMYSAVSDCKAGGLICYKINPKEYNKPALCDVHFGDITTSEIDGNTEVVIPVKLAMTGEYTTDCMDYSMAVTPAILFADENTGLIFEMQDCIGEGEYSYGGTIENGADSVSVSYSCEYHNAEGEWQEQEDGSFAKSIDFDVTYKIRVPKGYEELLICVVPVNSYDEYIDENEYENINEILEDALIYDVL